ncbi:ZYRO0B10406p [Zygosaccharomyces rouxii]|uniref:ZYRO0B10406p n=1 Tax=Zygosaccharomyces rouxii (strain ATCC 2623 / CBS 732 / NBRC 1130 / NCYC 568 / NRRL Y-229) TaxID=559307 RepID=C5DRQ7_ZYGRC|nr:uncharacterized protein ZYRO0B10406g [Zygosaccharomyces rouxii]KAH9199997.1 nuclear pore complex component-domain-containing protein [Zygosaccharomyces rouxii]CAR26468.1 ZYRO0B10406p [Zygosaccharomyces rouxii]
MVELATPSRPISREQFTSLRQRVAKDSPKLYKNKILSGPNGQLDVHTNQHKLSHTGGKGTPVATTSTVTRSSPPISQVPASTSNEIGSFENPVLHTLAQRTVNKEWETQRLVVNIIAWAIWDLLSKFCSTLAKHSKIGKEWVSWINRELVQRNINSNNSIVGFFNRFYNRYPSLWNKLNWSNLNFMFHLIVIINILFSLRRLLSKVKTDDLPLNENQRQLLGVVDQSDDSIVHHELVKESELVSSKESNTAPPEPPNTPFLFKSLETPMKSRQKQEADSIISKNVTQSAFVNRVNAFGLSQSALSNRMHPNTKNISNSSTGLFPSGLAATPAGKTGYIPSSKYTYMMNSPTPRKKT